MPPNGLFGLLSGTIHRLVPAPKRYEAGSLEEAKRYTHAYGYVPRFKGAGKHITYQEGASPGALRQTKTGT